MSKPRLEFSFPDPEGKPDVLVIAGEHSGDEHAARMVSDMLAKEPDLNVVAIGGRHLEAAGAQLLFDLTQFSIVGFVEVIKHLRAAFRLLDEILRWIETHQPRVVCFVDYPGLNLKIASKLFDKGLANKAGGPVRLVYYISPQVWAWKGKRRFQMAKYLDSLAVIFPFEVDTFADTDLETKFVGHPFLTGDYDLPVQYDPDAPVLLLAGSRVGAVSRIAPVLFGAFHECLKRKEKLKATSIYATDTLKNLMESEVAKTPGLAGRISFARNEGVIKASAVLTSSGTMSLNCALASIPGAVVYRMNTLTYWMGKVLVKLRFIGIANLLLDKPMYPEFIQGRANAKALATELIECIENIDRLRSTRLHSAELRELLSKPVEGGVSDWLRGFCK
ncbi:MAG: lipid-A-disaccharide synthase [Verrucomicrobiota bacterium]